MREVFAPVPGTPETLCACCMRKAISTHVDTVVRPGQAGCEGDMREVMTLTGSESRNSPPWPHLQGPFPKDKWEGRPPFSVFYCMTLRQGLHDYHPSCSSLPHEGDLCSIVTFAC